KIQSEYVKKLEKQLQQAYLESYGDYGQNLFERYFLYADAWIQDSDFRDPDTHMMWSRDQLNAECEKIEKAAGKTSLARWLIVGLSKGTSWLGCNIPHPIKVGYFCCDDPKPLFR